MDRETIMADPQPPPAALPDPFDRRVLATLCYLRQPGQTLMLLRNRKPGDIHAGKYNGLGGKLEPGETPEACVCREVHEECGLTLVEPSLRGLLTFPSFAAGRDWYVWVFVAHRFSGTQHDCPEGELRWVADHELLDLPLWEGDRIFLRWLAEGRFFSARMRYQDGRLIEHDQVLHPLLLADPSRVW